MKLSSWGVSRWFVLTFAAVLAVLVFSACKIFTTTAEAATNPVSAYIYLAPTPKNLSFDQTKAYCDKLDKNNGLSSTRPVCRYVRVNQIISTLKSQGKAKGNIYVKMANGTYSSTFLGRTLSADVAPGYTFFLVPSWFTYSMTTAPSSARPVIMCDTTRSNALGIRSTKATDKVKVAFITVSGCTNGMGIGGAFSYKCSSNDPVYGKTPIIGSTSPTMAQLTIDNVRIQKIGNMHKSLTREEIAKAAAKGITLKARSADDRGEAGLSLYNIQKLTVSNSVFQNLENNAGQQKFIHAVYIKASRNILITKNKFQKVGGNPIDLRHDNRKTIISKNTFTRSGDTAVAFGYYNGVWRSKEYSEPEKNKYVCVEKPSQKPTFSKNKLTKGTRTKARNYNGKLIILWDPSWDPHDLPK